MPNDMLPSRFFDMGQKVHSVQNSQTSESHSFGHIPLDKSTHLFFIAGQIAFFVSEQNHFWSFWWFNTPAVGWNQFLRQAWEDVRDWDDERSNFCDGIAKGSPAHRFSCFWIFLVCNPPRKNRKLIENDILRYHIHHLTRKALGSFVPRILNWSALGFNSGVHTRSAVDTSENPEKV